MTTLKRRAWLCMVLVAIALPIDLVVLKALTEPTVTDRARSWAEGLSDDQRSHYLRFGGIPDAYYSAVRRSLTARGYVLLFSDKFQDFQRSHPDLSEAQGKLLRTFMETITSGRRWGPRGGDKAAEEFASLGAMANHLFPDRAEFAQLFLIKRVNTVEQEPGTQRLVAWLLRALPAGAIHAATRDEEHETCECTNVALNDLCSPIFNRSHCCDNNACTWTPEYLDPDLEPFILTNGCGIGGQWNCLGLCDLNMIDS